MKGDLIKMELKTHHDVGDFVEVNGQMKRIIAMHLYINNKGELTERYFFGGNEWYTAISIKKSKSLKKKG